MDDETLKLRREFRREEAQRLNVKLREEVAVSALIQSAADYRREEIVKQWQHANRELHAAMLAVSLAVRHDRLPCTSAIEALRNCELRIHDDNVGLTNEENQGFLGAEGSTLAMDTQLAIIHEIMDECEGDPEEFDVDAAWDAAEASITWAMFVHKLESA